MIHDLFGAGEIESEHVEAIDSLALSPKICRECRKDILVAEWSPHPREEKATGMAAYRWGGNAGLGQKFAGWICNGCACRRAMETGDGPKGMIGGPMLEFTYDLIPS